MLCCVVLCCDQFDRGPKQVKPELVDLVTEDYDVSHCQRIHFFFSQNLKRQLDLTKANMLSTDKKAMQLMGEVKETSKKVQQLQEEEYRWV